MKVIIYSLISLLVISASFLPAFAWAEYTHTVGVIKIKGRLVFLADCEGGVAGQPYNCWTENGVTYCMVDCSR